MTTEAKTQNQTTECACTECRCEHCECVTVKAACETGCGCRAK